LGGAVHVDAHLLECSHQKSVMLKLSRHAFCVHCFRNLGAMRSAAQRVRTEAKHMCPEKLLATQPGAPPPYN
jgi:hypothetical protein